MTINTAMGLKSKPPKLGRFRLMGPRTGSVIWTTRLLMVTMTGWGLPPIRGTMNERMIRAKMAMVKRVKIVLIRPAKSETR